MAAGIVDVSAIGLDIKAKLENAFDVKSIFGIFESLITAVGKQQEEINALGIKLDKLGDLESSINILDQKFRSLQYHVHGFNSRDLGTPDNTIVWDHAGEHLLTASISTDIDQSPTVDKVIPASALDLDDPFSADASKTRVRIKDDKPLYEGPTEDFIIKRNAQIAAADALAAIHVTPDEKLLANAKEEKLLEDQRLSRARNNSKNLGWRSKRHRLLLALQLRGQTIREARRSAAYGNL